MSSIAAPLRVWLLLWLACWSWAASAEVAVPALTARVTDLTGTLSAEQQQTLEQSLQAFEQRKGSQLAVLIVPTTEPETIEQFSLRVVEQWKLGRKNVDDGALLIVAKNDRTLRIEVGYGLEGALNDAVSKRIISEVITPLFRQGDFYGGISAGLDRMMRVTDGEPLPPPPSGSSGRAHDQGFLVVFAIAMVAGGFFRALLGNLTGALVAGGLVGGLAWLVTGAFPMAVIAGLAAAFFALFGDSLRSGGWGGGGGFGSGGGGGFSGGGGFGGGGASGRW